MKRVGQVIKVKEEYLEKYKKLHAAPWPEVNEMIKNAISRIILFTTEMGTYSAILNMWEKITRKI